MKLLFDQNLSPSLVAKLADIFPGSDHVYYLGLDTTNDREVRLFAAENGFIVVTKDSDYSDMHSLYGFPPDVIWIRRGNCSTKSIEEILRENLTSIVRLVGDRDSGILTIY